MLDVVADSVILLNCFYIAFYILQVFKAVGATSWGLGYQIAAHGAAWSARRIPHRNLTPRARPPGHVGLLEVPLRHALVVQPDLPPRAQLAAAVRLQPVGDRVEFREGGAPTGRVFAFDLTNGDEAGRARLGLE